MIRQELYKIFSGKVTIFLVASVLILNIVQLVYLENRADIWTAESYNEVWEEIYATEDGNNAAKEWIDSRMAEVSAEWDSMSFEEQYNAKYYGDDIYIRLQLLSEIQREIEYATGYNDYLAGIDEAVKRYELIAVFSEPDAYAYRELLEMKEPYEQVGEKELDPAPSAGISMASQADITDILALVLLLYLTVTVWLKEREQSMLLLIRTTKNGKVKLAVCKVAVLMFLCMCMAVSLYGSNFIVSGLMYDLGDLSRPLATVYEYRSTLWDITVGEFIIFNMFFKMFSYVFIMLLLSMICLCVHSSVAAFTGIVLVSGIGCFMYYKIPAVSVWAAFKYLNPFGVLKTEMFFEGYKGLNFFDYPLDYRHCIIVLFIVGYIVFSILIIKFFTDYIIKGKRKTIKLFKQITGIIVKLRRKGEMHTRVLLHEMHRILICHGVLVVIAIASVLIISDVSSYKVRYSNETDYCEAYYLKMLEGPVTDEKIAFIEEEEARVANPTDDMEKAQKKAIKRIKARLSYIIENDACFIYDIPHYEFTAGYRHNEDFMWAVYVMILLVLCIPSFFAPDLQNGMYRIIEVTAKGRKKIKLLRHIFGGALAVLFVIMVHLVRFIYVMCENEVKPEVMTYPVNSLMHLEAFGTDMSVGGYYLILYILWIASAIMGATLIYRLSAWIKSPAYTILAGIVVLILPMLIALYSEGLMYVSYPHSIFAGNLFMQNKGAALICILIWGLFLVLERIVTIFVKAKRSGK